jgi:S-adenosylmethionine:tRNA ribosyltransferase-isomerase
MISQKDIKIEGFDYFLPEEKIALYPLSERDSSKLLVYKNGDISETVFRNIADEIPENALLVFNDTKVIHARILAYTSTGARIEIFCLEPIEPIDVQLAFQQNRSTKSELNEVKNRCVWKCFVGGNRKWKDGLLQISTCHPERSKGTAGKQILRYAQDDNLSIKRGRQLDDAWEIIFEWSSDLTFAEILENVGKIPLPPYIHREVEESDKDRYQTIFAKIKGSVAAPTASLHFTDEVLKSLEKRRIETTTLTLHVGAGTFKPVTTEKIGDHVMHDEKVIISQDCLQKICKAKSENRPIIAVGTTSLRSLESLFWLKQGDSHVEQWTPYNYELSITNYKRNYQFVIRNYQLPLQFSTALMITPGYDFKIATGIITNFHQPKSTLLLLISAIVGDNWKKIYYYALSHDFRFLSYGDSSLLFFNPHQSKI